MFNSQTQFWNLFLIIGLIGCATKAIMISFNNDIYVYWAATRVFYLGKNAYDPIELASILNIPSTAGVWNPPWFFLILGPLAFFPKKIALIILVFSNLLVFNLIITNFQKIYNHKHSSFAVIACLLGSYSFFANFWLPQISLILTYCLLKSWECLINSKFRFALLWLLPLTIKPHLGFCLILFILIKLIKQKEYSSLIFSLLLLLILILLSYIVNPLSTNLWVSGSVYPFQWQGSSLSIFIQERLTSLVNSDKILSRIPLVLALIGCISVIVLEFFTSTSKKYSENTFIFLIILNLLFTPYGFIFDQISIIFLLYIIADKFSLLVSSLKSKIIFLQFLFFIGWCVPLIFEISYREYYIYQPLVLIFLYLIIQKSSLYFPIKLKSLEV